MAHWEIEKGQEWKRHNAQRHQDTIRDRQGETRGANDQHDQGKKNHRRHHHHHHHHHYHHHHLHKQCKETR
ncbi:hypothetical protein E2C01_049237 [Portunus trituberculatus]|uniref:Uncharacterized protein n=1 Tax=Portunus trituberculatus TaxID=210409 RepID=A0A5B7GD60_PORTR|nr:hypothetical protein [Portunus trituberculatus]